MILFRLMTYEENNYFAIDLVSPLGMQSKILIN